jgi:hypothetical protein
MTPNPNFTVADITFAPLVPWALLGVVGAVALVLIAVVWYRRANGSILRTIAIAAALLALANPSLINEKRQPLNDVAAIVVDRSASQNIASRATASDTALKALTERLAREDNLDVRVVQAAADNAARTSDDEGTRIFDAVRDALADVPSDRIAGTIVISDGQIHDTPENLRGPVHGLMTGERREGDRRLVIQKAPTYGMVDGELNLVLRVEETGAKDSNKAARRGAPARLTLRRDGGKPQHYDVEVGRNEIIPFKLDHAGQTVLEIDVAKGSQELTLRNNRAAIVVNGVRDRLRVLLVSGEPHAGERTWRNLLKADPSVDLVHFTILRPPEKQDGTPVRELSLIAFPIFELFEMRLEEFDLVIFDRYRRRGVLPPGYFLNIANYVARGGALLAAAGPEFASALSIHQTALGDVLPATPSGEIIEAGFRPRLTEVGGRHPVTADLPGAPRPGEAGQKAEAAWGRWFRLIDAKTDRGLPVMQGAGDRPLLLLDRVGEGRVAQILSDHAWLWTRGFEGGGPQAELLRRMAHWLMKEPALEEEDLRAEVTDGRLRVTRRSVGTTHPPVQITGPSGKQQTLKLNPETGGRAVADIAASETGVYRIGDGVRTTVAVAGALNPREFAEVHATDEHLAVAAAETGGGVFWLADGAAKNSGLPRLRRVRTRGGSDRDLAGRDWLGLRANGAYTVTGVDHVPLMPGLLALLLILGCLTAAWWREGH